MITEQLQKRLSDYKALPSHRQKNYLTKGRNQIVQIHIYFSEQNSKAKVKALLQKLKKIDSTINRPIQAKVTTNWNNTIFESPWITFESNTTKNLGSASIGYGYYPGPTVLSLKTLKNYSSETNFNGEWIYDTY